MTEAAEQAFQEDRVNPTQLYQEALVEHPRYGRIPSTEIKTLISSVLEEIRLLEEIGEEDKERNEMPSDIAKNIGAIWVFSGPGTYDSPTKEDKYKDFLWARGMDRARLNYAAILARKVAEARSGQNFNNGSLQDLNERKQKIKEMIREYGLDIIYNGTQVENDTVASVLSREGTIIPEEKVDIIRGEIVITLDQVKIFKLPEDFDQNKELAIISHAPHLARIIRMINRFPPFPQGTTVRLLPLPTPGNGKKEYAKMEALGVLRYHYLDNQATGTSYPYKVGLAK